MKQLFFIFIFSFLFLKSSFAQTVTTKKLIGIWQDADTWKKKFSIDFIDASHLTVRDVESGVSNGTYKLKTNNAHQTLLTIILNKEGINHYDHYIISFIKPGILKFQNTGTNDPIAQQLYLPSNSFFITRKKPE